MKILIIGGSGVIGWQLVRHFANQKVDVHYTYLAHNPGLTNGYSLDITKKDSTVKLIEKIKPDIVIHTTALANVDLCETNHSLADSINIQGTANVIDGCKLTKSRFFYVSTSFVFDGKKTEYVEEDLPAPATYYGITKYKGEELTKNSGLSYLILRTDQPYCWIEKWQHTNSVIRILTTLKTKKILREIVDWYNVPTYVPDFVLATENLLNQNLEGIFHIVGSDFINRYDWSLKVADAFNLEKNMIEPISSDTLNLPAKRVNVNLRNQKLLKKTGIHMMGIDDGLKAMLNNYDVYNFFSEKM